MASRIVSVLFLNFEFVDYQDNDWPWNKNEQTLPYSIGRDVQVPRKPDGYVLVETAGQVVKVYGWQLGVEE